MTSVSGIDFEAPVTPGHGSCIFARIWAGPDLPVASGTGVAKADLSALLSWLQPGAAAWAADARYTLLKTVFQITCLTLLASRVYAMGGPSAHGARFVASD